MQNPLRTLARLVLSASARHDARYEWARRLRGEPPLPDGRMQRVLVLCHGNICRSPFAAVLLAARLPQLEVRSGGLQAANGDPADATAARCAQRRGISLAAHRSARVNAESLGWADLVLVMQGSHVAEIERAWPQFGPRVRLLGDFLADPPYLLPDPWGKEEAVFERVFTRLADAVERLAVRIEKRQATTS